MQNQPELRQTFSQICQKRLRRPPLETHHTIVGAPEHDNLSSPWLFSVVGVAATARNRGLQELPEPAIYVPYKMATTPGVAFLLKTDLDPLSLAHAARQRLRSVDGGLPVTQVRTLEEYLSRFERAYPRFSMTLFTIFATLGFLLAATGLFSVVSYAVAQRTHEFGIRMALGAEGRHVPQLVAGSVTALIATGTVTGLAGSVALSGTIARFVEGWNPRDPVAYFAVFAVLAFTGLLACWLPARRATANRSDSRTTRSRLSNAKRTAARHGQASIV